MGRERLKDDWEYPSAMDAPSALRPCGDRRDNDMRDADVRPEPRPKRRAFVDFATHFLEDCR